LRVVTSQENVYIDERKVFPNEKNFSLLASGKVKNKDFFIINNIFHFENEIN